MKDYIYVLPIVMSTMCYAINQLWYEDKLRWITNGDGFWGKDSWVRKYKCKYTLLKTGSFIREFDKAPNTWYYRFFKIKYKERFPFSATFLVMFTDGMHLTQHFYFIFLVLSMVTTPHDWQSLLIASATLLFSFWFWYKILSK